MYLCFSSQTSRKLIGYWKNCTWMSSQMLISINKSIASSHHNVIPSLITLHALSGYNSVAMMVGIDQPVKVPDVMREGKQFVTKCYGRNQLSSYENRCAIWKNKTVDHSVQKVWIPPSIDTPSLYGHALVFIFFSKPPAFGKTFSTISPQWNTW